MSQAVSAQHPAVVLRSSYLHLRTLLAIAAIAIVCLTAAVVVLALNTGSTTASPATRVSSAIRANPSAETGARLNHSGRLLPSSPQAETGARLNHSGRLLPSLPQPGPISTYYLGHR